MNNMDNMQIQRTLGVFNRLRGYQSSYSSRYLIQYFETSILCIFCICMKQRTSADIFCIFCTYNHHMLNRERRCWTLCVSASALANCAMTLAAGDSIDFGLLCNILCWRSLHGKGSFVYPTVQEIISQDIWPSPRTLPGGPGHALPRSPPGES
jgi:hypothetical protein